jgi:hypothetical protein
LNERLAKQLLSVHFLSTFALDLSSAEIVLAVYRILAVSYEPINWTRLISMNYPFPLSINPTSSSFFSVVPLLSKIWEFFPDFGSFLKDFISNMFTDAAFHSLHKHPSALIVKGTARVRNDFLFLIVPSYFREYSGFSISVNSKPIRIPHIITNTGDLTIESRHEIAILPIRNDDRDWIWQSPFELLILMKHLYCLSKSGVHLSFVKTIFVDSVIVGSPIISLYTNNFLELFLERSSLSVITPDYIAHLSYAWFSPAKTQLVQASRFCDFVRSELEYCQDFNREQITNFLVHPAMSLRVLPIGLDIPPRVDQASFLGRLARLVDSFSYIDLLPFWLYWARKSETIELASAGQVHSDFLLDANFVRDCWTPQHTAHLLAVLDGSLQKPISREVFESVVTADCYPCPNAVRIMGTIIVCVNAIFLKNWQLFSSFHIRKLYNYIAPRNQLWLLRSLVPPSRGDPLNVFVSRDSRRPLISQFVQFFVTSSPQILRVHPVPWRVTSPADEFGALGVELFSEIASSIFHSRAGLVQKVAQHRYIISQNAFPEKKGELYSIGSFLMIALRAKISFPFPFADIFWASLCGRELGEVTVTDADPQLGDLFMGLRRFDIPQKWETTDWNGNKKVLRTDDSWVGRGDVQNYVNEVVRFRVELLLPAMLEIRRGFMENGGLSEELLMYFVPEVVRNAVEGENSLSVNDFRTVVQFERVTAEDQALFWDALGRLSNEERILLLNFGTGLMRLPILPEDRFEVKFGIRVDRALPGNPPLLQGNTCSRQIVMGKYRSAAELHQRMVESIRGSRSFE